MRRDAQWLGQLGALQRVVTLTEQKDYEEARNLLLKVRATARGKRSGHVAWSLAIVADYMGELEMAFDFIEEAIAADPLAVPYHQSFDIITDRIRSALSDEDRAADDPSTPKLYKLLVAAGEADLKCHLVMARYYASQHDYSAALRLLEAATTLEPTCRDAWVALAEVARAAGNQQLADRAAFEIAALADGPMVPFSIPGQALG